MSEQDPFSDIMASTTKGEDAFAEQARIAFSMADVLTTRPSMSEYMDHLNHINSNTLSLDYFIHLIHDLQQTESSVHERFALQGKPICDGYSMGLEVARRMSTSLSWDARIFEQTEKIITQLRLDTSDDADQVSDYLCQIGYDYYYFAQPVLRTELERPVKQEPLYDAFTAALRYEALYDANEYDNLCAGLGIALLSLQLTKEK